MFRRRVSVLLALVVAALGIGLWGAVGFASPKDNNGHNIDEGRTLTVLTKSRDARVVDLGPQGPTHGDMRVVNAPLYNESRQSGASTCTASRQTPQMSPPRRPTWWSVRIPTPCRTERSAYWA